MPSGWWKQAVSQATNVSWDHVITPIDLGDIRALSQSDANIASALATPSIPSELATSFVSRISRLARNCYISRVRAQLVAIACTLELYYLEHGSYPKNLEPLAIERDILLDPLNLSPVRYEYFPERPHRYRLYFEGWDEVDDGGTPWNIQKLKGDHVLTYAPVDEL